MNDTMGSKSKTTKKELKEEVKILSRQVSALEYAYLKKRAAIEHIRKIFIYELGKEKWERVIQSPDIDQEFEALKEKPVSIPELFLD